MASYQWIKLYHEILDDPKMGRMDDHLWRRTIELFLIAGKVELGGQLPPIDDIAWTLRTTTEDISECLEKLAGMGVISASNKEVIVTNFQSRQATSLTDAERAKRYRDKKAVVTEQCDNASRDDVTSVTDDENEVSRQIKIKNKNKNREDEERELKELTADAVETRPPRPKIIKIPHGVLENVMLTDQEYDNFRDKCASENIGPDAIVDELSTYIPNKPGKPYKSHYAALLTFLRTSIDRRQKTPAQAVGGRQQSKPQRGVLGMDFVELLKGNNSER